MSDLDREQRKAIREDGNPSIGTSGWMTIDRVREAKGLGPRSNKASRHVLLHLSSGFLQRPQNWAARQKLLHRLYGALVLAAAFLFGQCVVVPLEKEVTPNK